MRRASIYVAICGLVGACLAGLVVAPTVTATLATSGKHKTSEPRIRLKLIGTSYTPVYTDGVRWAVYEPTEGVTRIMDTIKGTSTTRPDPEGCAGGLVAIGGGEMFYACSDLECPEAADNCLLKVPETFCPPAVAGTSCVTEMVPSGYEIGRWIVEDIASGAQHLLNIGKGLPTSNRRDVESESELTGIGSQWAASASGWGAYFVNWHTGQVIYERKEPTSADRDYENLDSEALLVPLCSPFTRSLEPTGPGIEGPRYLSLTYEPPFLVEDRFIGLRAYAYLRRCGSSRTEPIPVELGGPFKGVLVGVHHLRRLNAHGRS